MIKYLKYFVKMLMHMNTSLMVLFCHFLLFQQGPDLDLETLFRTVELLSMRCFRIFCPLVNRGYGDPKDTLTSVCERTFS